MKISYTLREIRKKNKMTQEQFAKKFSISRYSLINYEKASRKIPLPLHKKIEEAYDINLIDLYHKPTYTLAKQVVSFPEDKSVETAINPLPKITTSPIIYPDENRDKTKIEIFKDYLSSNEYPVQFMSELDILKLEKSICDYIEFQLFKKGYIKKSTHF